MKNFLFVIIIAPLLLVSCSSGGLSFGSVRKVSFFDDQNFHSKTMFEGFPLGGLSGIRYHDGKLFTISDDRSEKGPARIVVFDLALTANSFNITPSKTIILKDEKGFNFKKGSVDFEGIDILEDGGFYISSEGALKQGIQPEIFHFGPDGELIKRIPLPSKFHHKTVGTTVKGIRDNLSIESLVKGHSDREVWVATEESLGQDGEIASIHKASYMRMLKFLEGYPVAEYAYPNSKMPNPTGRKSLKGLNGLVDLEILPGGGFLSIERAWSSTTKKQTIRLFKVSTADATDVSTYFSLDGMRFSPVKKKLVADFDQFIDQMDPKFKRLDNIEGICFGPMLDDEHRLLIVVSDNNFSKHQRTLFMGFKIKEGR